VTKLTLEMAPAAAADVLAADAYDLKIELSAVYDSRAEHGRALASLLLAIHRWLEEQEAPSVDVVLDGRRFTIRTPDN
jgi:hypothetical protein